jgi:outer membrane protein OmpA-like peptidoglycan-associated protein
MSEIDELPSWAPKSEQPDSAPAPGRGRGRGRALLYGLLALLGIVVAAGGAFLVVAGGDETETTSGDEIAGTPPSSEAETEAAGETTATGAPDEEGGAGTESAESSDAGGDSSADDASPRAAEEVSADNSDGSIRHTSIEDGKFVLNGTVPTQELLDQIYAITANSAGAENVVNNLTIDPGSPDRVDVFPIYIRDVVLFDVGSTEVREEFEWLLVAGAEFLVQNEQHTITVIGHADSSGSPEANQTLSEERAQSVKDIYIALGAPADRIYAIGKGEEGAIEGATDSQAAEERRVEFFVGYVSDGEPAIAE